MRTNYLVDGFKIGEDIFPIPYNLENKEIEEQDILDVLNKYNISIPKINEIKYFRQSFTHSSYIDKKIIPENVLNDSKIELGNPPELLELRPNSYERLEFFGDKVLKLIVSFYLFHRYPKEDEGFMTRLQTKIEDKKNLAIMSKEMGLGKFFIISRQIELMSGRNLDKLHEDMFEAFIGALFLSNGFEPCLYLITNLLETLIDYSEKLYCDNNYKDRLLRLHHQNKWTFPEYIPIYHEGPPHKRKYIMGVKKHDSNSTNIEDMCISYGIGNSKKEGEQYAAKMSLIILGILKEDQYSSSDIYYPPFDKIKNHDGVSNILFNDNKEIIEDNEITDDNKEISDVMSEKSV